MKNRRSVNDRRFFCAWDLLWMNHRLREQARSHSLKCIPPVGASLLAKNDNAVSGLRVNPIQRPIHRQLGQHDDLLNRQRRIALGPAQLIGKVTG